MTIIQAIQKLRNDLKLWVANNLRTKVDKEDGKGLSSNDFTNIEKIKLEGIEEGATKVIIDSIPTENSENAISSGAIYKDFLSIATAIRALREDFNVYNTVSGKSEIYINAAESDFPIEVTLSSDVYTDFSNINVILNGQEDEQITIADSTGVITGLYAKPEFTISVSSEVENFDAELVTITCKYLLNIEEVLHDYILHVDIDEENNGITNKDYFNVDNTLSLSGVAADSKKTGDEIAKLKEMIGNSSISEQIAEALVEVYVQDDEPENAAVGSIWVDTEEKGLDDSQEQETYNKNLYVIDANNSNTNEIDFSGYSAGDIILITTS